MKVFKVFIDLDQEEQYLRGMAGRGYAFVKSNSWGVYTFQKVEPQVLNYRIDYRLFESRSQFQEYITLFADLGWRHIYGTRSSGSQYFLPKSSEVQEEDIFSDQESKAGRYKRMKSQFVASFFLMLSFFIISMPEVPNGHSLFSFYRWYFTPGLWEKTGGDFWRAFLFETPFFLLRVGPLVILLLLTIIYGYSALKAWRLQRAYQNTYDRWQ